MEEIQEKIKLLKEKIESDEKYNEYINLTIYQNMVKEIEFLVIDRTKA